MQKQSNCEITFDTQLKTALSKYLYVRKLLNVVRVYHIV